jgi:hypothetical protein
MKRTYNFQKVILGWTLGFLTILTVACRPQVEQDGVYPVRDGITARQAARYKVDAAKTWAKAVHNESIREFLKEEALKKFDGDYEVLYQFVQGKKMKNGKLLSELLSSYDASPQHFKEVNESLPLLTIYVPTFFSAAKWNTSTQIPIVAVRDENERLIAFNKNGDSVELSPNEEPNIPIIVLKLSDRVAVKQQNTKSAGGRLAGGNFIFSNGKQSFFFVDQSFNNINPQTKGARLVLGLMDPVFMEAYRRSVGCGNCYQRDWIYYGINPASGNNSGPLSYKFKEAITEIEPENIGVFDTMGGWDDGAFVLNLNAMFGSRTQPTKEAPQKVISIPAEYLFTYHEEIRHRGIFGINTYTVRIVDGVKPYQLSTPVTYEPWDMEEYGDKWTLLVEEFDQSTEITRTFTSTDTFGYNFTVTAGSKEKVGASLGANGGFTKGTTITYKTTDVSDNLGGATVRYTDPVITYAGDIWGYPAETTHMLPTGSLKISFETVRVAQ